jgi:hypothetical protein
MLEPLRKLLSLLELLGKIHEILLLLCLSNIRWQVLELLQIYIRMKSLLKLRSFVFLAKVNLLEEVILAIEETLKSKVVSVKFSPLIL